MTGSKLLRKYLDDTGQSQIDLARATKLDQGMISRWVNGERGPGLVNALLLERLTGGAVPAASWAAKRRKRAA